MQPRSTAQCDGTLANSTWLKAASCLKNILQLNSQIDALTKLEAAD